MLVDVKVLEAAHQVMTLSGTGDAETPAGGSVCMRYMYGVSIAKVPKQLPSQKSCRTLKSRIRRRRAAVDILVCRDELGPSVGF